MTITGFSQIPDFTVNLQRLWKPLYTVPATKNKLLYK